MSGSIEARPRCVKSALPIHAHRYAVRAKTVRGRAPERDRHANSLIPRIAGRGTEAAFCPAHTQSDPGAARSTRGDSLRKAMKLVAAIIKPFKLDEVRRAVADLGLMGLTVTDVLGFGQRAQREYYRSAEYTIDFAPRTKIEVAVDDAIVEPVVEAIGNVARTGQNGDGKIFVLDLAEVIRIRTGEMGAAAI